MYQNKNKMKVGDIITAYHAGYHRLEEIHEDSHLCTYVTIADSSGNPKKGTTKKKCSLHYCKMATDHIDEEILFLSERIEKLNQFRKERL